MYYDFAPYVPVAQRRANAKRELAKQAKKGFVVSPVENVSRKIASTFWGQGWCQHLESFADFSNRLPRGRTYVRNGSVVHLGVEKGHIEAYVSGSELYKIKIEIAPLASKSWRRVQELCAGQVGSLVELLQGKLSQDVMRVVTDREQGLFPRPEEIKMSCSCPDWAGLCKHLAATLYGVGARLDLQPELLFHLRGVDHHELIAGVDEIAKSTPTKRGKGEKIAAGDLSEIFGVEIEGDNSSANAPPEKPSKSRQSARRASPASPAEPRTGRKPRAQARLSEPDIATAPDALIVASAEIAPGSLIDIATSTEVAARPASMALARRRTLAEKSRKSKIAAIAEALARATEAVEQSKKWAAKRAESLEQVASARATAAKGAPARRKRPAPKYRRGFASGLRSARSTDQRL